MLEKLAKQTAIYGISTIVGRFLSYLLTPYYTRVFGQAEYGIITDIYALIPFALVVLTMGMESGYFRFAAKADAAGGDVKAAKKRLFSTVWGITSLAAVAFFAAVAALREYCDSVGALELSARTDVAKVSIVGAGMESHAGVASKMFEALYDKQINIRMISTSEIKISVLIDAEYCNKAVQAVHDAFID